MCGHQLFLEGMGGYFTKKEGKTSDETTGKEGTDSSREDVKKKSKYKVVYVDREVKVSELPRDLSSLFVLRRTG